MPNIPMTPYGPLPAEPLDEKAAAEERIRREAAACNLTREELHACLDAFQRSMELAAGRLREFGIAVNTAIATMGARMRRRYPSYYHARRRAYRLEALAASQERRGRGPGAS